MFGILQTPQQISNTAITLAGVSALVQLSMRACPGRPGASRRCIWLRLMTEICGWLEMMANDSGQLAKDTIRSSGLEAGAWAAQPSTLHNVHYRLTRNCPSCLHHDACPVSRKLANLTHPGGRLGGRLLSRHDPEPGATPRPTRQLGAAGSGNDMMLKTREYPTVSRTGRSRDAADMSPETGQ